MDTSEMLDGSWDNSSRLSSGTETELSRTEPSIETESLEPNENFEVGSRQRALLFAKVSDLNERDDEGPLWVEDVSLRDLVVDEDALSCDEKAETDCTDDFVVRINFVFPCGGVLLPNFGLFSLAAAMTILRKFERGETVVAARRYTCTEGDGSVSRWTGQREIGHQLYGNEKKLRT